MKDGGVRLVALRSAGYNHVDLEAAARLELRVVRVPEYSPYAVAEHSVALVLALNLRIHQAYARVRDWNFSLEGLVGFDLHGKTVGLIGTGRIGRAAAHIFRGFGCRVLFCATASWRTPRSSGSWTCAQDDVLARPLTFHNVLVTSHQAFLTREALGNIAETTLGSVASFERGEPLAFEVRASQVLRPAPSPSGAG